MLCFVIGFSQFPKWQTHRQLGKHQLYRKCTLLIFLSTFLFSTSFPSVTLPSFLFLKKISTLLRVATNSMITWFPQAEFLATRYSEILSKLTHFWVHFLRQGWSYSFDSHCHNHLLSFPRNFTFYNIKLTPFFVHGTSFLCPPSSLTVKIVFIFQGLVQITPPPCSLPP